MAGAAYSHDLVVLKSCLGTSVRFWEELSVLLCSCSILCLPHGSPFPALALYPLHFPCEANCRRERFLTSSVELRILRTFLEAFPLQKDIPSGVDTSIRH